MNYNWSFIWTFSFFFFFFFYFVPCFPFRAASSFREEIRTAVNQRRTIELYAPIFPLLTRWIASPFLFLFFFPSCYQPTGNIIAGLRWTIVTRDNDPPSCRTKIIFLPPSRNLLSLVLWRSSQFSKHPRCLHHLLSQFCRFYGRYHKSSSSKRVLPLVCSIISKTRFERWNFGDTFVRETRRSVNKKN